MSVDRIAMFNVVNTLAGTRSTQPDRIMLEVGDGVAGDKAWGLQDNAEILAREDVMVPPTVTLTSDFLNDALTASGLPTMADLDAGDHDCEILDGKKLSSEITNFLSELAQGITAESSLPVIFRSSALDDARGNGIYHSQACAQEPGALSSAFAAVLRSAFTPKARAVRRLICQSVDMGVVIQPLVGQSHDSPIAPHSPVWAPVISGIAFSSLGSKEGFCYFEPGLGCAVSSIHGLHLTPSNLSMMLAYGIDDLFASRSADRAEYLRNLQAPFTHHIHDLDEYLHDPSLSFIQAFSPQSGKITPDCPVRIFGESASHQAVKAKLENVLQTFFDRLSRIEERRGKPFYLEWAVTIRGDSSPEIHALQVADLKHTPDEIDFADLKHVLLDGYQAVGHANQVTHTILIIKDGADLNELAKLDSRLESYILVYDSNIISRGQPIDLRIISKAIAVLDWHNGLGQRNTRPLYHWQGEIEQSGKSYGVINGHLSDNPITRPATLSRDKIVVLQGHFRYISSHWQGQFAVIDESN